MSVETLGPLLLSAGIGYLLGSFPSGYVFVRTLTGTDVRTVGSGKTGGTNVFRAAGKTALILTALADISKALAAVLIARALFSARSVEALAGFFAIAGHIWSVFLRFRGGGGVGTATGALIALSPLSLLVGVPLFLVVLYIWRYASLASLTAMTGAALAVFALGQEPPEIVLFAFGAWALIVIAHRANIRRLLTGTERHLGAPR